MSRVSDYADGIAQRLGQPMSGQQLNKDQVLERWNFSPLGDTQQADAQYHQMVAQGVPPGQALDQVYPYRKMLLSGPDLKSQIDTANQIAQWNADANGTQPPQPNPQQSPILQQPQQPPMLPPPPAGPQPGPVLPGAGGPNPVPAAAPSPLPVQGPPPGLGSPAPGPMPMAGLGQPMPQIQPVPMAEGGVVTQPTIALIGEQGPEAVVPLAGAAGPAATLTNAASTSSTPPLTDVTSGNYPSAQPVGADPNATPDQIGQYIQQAAIQRGIDPGVAIQVALHEGFAQGQPAAQGTFATGSSWWPFQLHYGGQGYEQYGNVAGLGNDFTAQTGWQPGDPRAWQAATDFALDTALQRGWYPTFYGSVPAGVSKWQGIPQQQQRAA